MPALAASTYVLLGETCTNHQILKVAEIEKTEDIRRPYIKQLTAKNLRFPLPHRRTRAAGIYAGKRPSTFY